MSVQSRTDTPEGNGMNSARVLLMTLSERTSARGTGDAVREGVRRYRARKRGEDAPLRRRANGKPWTLAELMANAVRTPAGCVEFKSSEATSIDVPSTWSDRWPSLRFASFERHAQRDKAQAAGRAILEHAGRQASEPPPFDDEIPF